MNRSPDEMQPGFRYPEWESSVTRERQTAKHRCAGVNSALFGDQADITFFGMDSILATRRAGLSVNGSVHMQQIFHQRAPIALDERLTVRGRVATVEPAKRGHVIRSSFEFVRADGSVPLACERIGLRVDPTAASAANSNAEGKRAAAPDPREGMTLLCEKRLAPEQVAAYSDEAENLIHSDPEVARRFGFRAPIAAGLMGTHFVLEALLRRGGAPAELDMEMRFLRPMFWDDALSVYGRDGPDGMLAEIRIVNAAGKVTGHATVQRVVLPR